MNWVSPTEEVKAHIRGIVGSLEAGDGGVRADLETALDNLIAAAQGPGTPAARMRWFWDTMHEHEDTIMEVLNVGEPSREWWSPVKNEPFESAIHRAFVKLAEERKTLQDLVERLDNELLDAQSEIDYLAHRP